MSPFQLSTTREKQPHTWTTEHLPPREGTFSEREGPSRGRTPHSPAQVRCGVTPSKSSALFLQGPFRSLSHTHTQQQHTLRLCFGQAGPQTAAAGRPPPQEASQVRGANTRTRTVKDKGVCPTTSLASPLSYQEPDSAASLPRSLPAPPGRQENSGNTGTGPGVCAVVLQVGVEEQAGDTLAVPAVPPPPPAPGLTHLRPAGARGHTRPVCQGARATGTLARTPYVQGDLHTSVWGQRQLRQEAHFSVPRE